MPFANVVSTPKSQPVKMALEMLVPAIRLLRSAAPKLADVPAAFRPHSVMLEPIGAERVEEA